MFHSDNLPCVKPLQKTKWKITICSVKTHYFYGHYKQRTGTSPFLMGQLTISMTMFDSELLVITRLRILQTFAHQLEALAMATVFHSVRCSGFSPVEPRASAAGLLWNHHHQRLMPWGMRLGSSIELYILTIVFWNRQTLRTTGSSILQGNGGFRKWGHPQIMYFKRIFHYKPSILGHPHLWNPPDDLPTFSHQIALRWRTMGQLSPKSSASPPRKDGQVAHATNRGDAHIIL